MRIRAGIVTGALLVVLVTVGSTARGVDWFPRSGDDGVGGVVRGYPRYDSRPPVRRASGHHLGWLGTVLGAAAGVVGTAAAGTVVALVVRSRRRNAPGATDPGGEPREVSVDADVEAVTGSTADGDVVLSCWRQLEELLTARGEKLPEFRTTEWVVRRGVERHGLPAEPLQMIADTYAQHRYSSRPVTPDRAAATVVQLMRVRGASRRG